VCRRIPPLAIAPGTRLGPYEITAQLGVGGMGEVYRARDTRLKRDVALKILPESFAADPDRLARFQREAEVLASLNHPHIAAIYGIEESKDVRALVMELVEGETLAERIARGRLPLDDALHIGKQIGEALEAAHEQGIVHRDLKPANIKITSAETVKVLDFGLAKLAQPEHTTQAGTAASPSMSPTITSPALMTGVGVLLGTAAYMSPEQAKGRPADKRSDIWAFGCVLYEMLTGERPFDGEDVTDVLVSVLGREPVHLESLPDDVPVAIRTLIRRCLEKERRRRIQDIAAALFVIDETANLVTRIEVSVPAQPDASAVQPLIEAAVASAVVAERGRLEKSARSRLLVVGVVTWLAGIAIAAASIWFALRAPTERVSRLTIATSAATALAVNGIDRDLAVTPDGSRVVYVGNNGAELFVRPLDSLESTSVYKGGPRGPFVSPDGQWIAFMDGGNVLRKVAITGGPAVTIVNVDGSSRGATWMPDGTIVFATALAATGLQRVSAAGGSASSLTRPDREHGEGDHVWPEVLPGGQAVLFTIFPSTGNVDGAQIAVIDLKTRTQKVLVRGGSNAQYVSSGHLVYTVGNTLRAVPFDPVTLETHGAPVPVVAEVASTGAIPSGGADAAIAEDGTLAYIRGAAGAISRRSLVWVDRQGREASIAAPNRAYYHTRISPDGSRIATWANDQESDIWMWDLTRLTLTRATFTPGLDLFPVWSPDGRRLFFSSEREGARNLFSEASDGSGTVERLTRSPEQQNATAVTPDGARLIFTQTTPNTGDDVMQIELRGNRTITALVQSPFTERNAAVSPDGHWLAYEANDSGEFQIYVRPYPDVNSGHWQISTGGGTRPLWSHNGQELFYVSPTDAIMRVSVERGSSWTATTPTIIVKEGYVTAAAIVTGRNYDVSADGQRFLMLKPATDPNVSSSQIVVVQHFDQELKRLVPGK
jgi:Tol biopolymer transport system component